MPNLLAMSFEGELAPAFELHCLEQGRVPPDGWGLACYPGGEPAALVLKEAAPSQATIRSSLVASWERLASTLFVVHIRTAKWGALTEANTQPFVRAWGRRDWVIAHSGSLEHKLVLSGRFEPVGSTDTEQVLCEVLSRAADAGWKSIGEIPPETLLAWFSELNKHGALTLTLSDGTDLAVYADMNSRGRAFVREILPPHGPISFGDNDLTVDLTRRGIHARKGLIICSEALEQKTGEAAHWRQLMPGHLLICRQGAVRAELGPAEQHQGTQQHPVNPAAFNPPQAQQFNQQSALSNQQSPNPQNFNQQGSTQVNGPMNQEQFTQERAPAPSTPAGMPNDTQAFAPHASGVIPPLQPFVPRARPILSTARAEIRRYQVVHRTVYTYTQQVERSMHLLRLFPAHDRLQRLIDCQVTSSVQPGEQRDFEDVFGNRARRMLVSTPFSEMTIEATSQVELLDTEPLAVRPGKLRSTLPLAWMPWQRQILQPFLLPPELPESELDELNEYTKSFADRNDGELLDTLLDINSTIFSEYQYQSGSTTLATSAFDVYSQRRGVCQDFTNLFICLARLLGVPARYVCGYLYTHAESRPDQQRMADASHAWVQVYLPEVGWKGFDPTNGVLTQTEHVRVAVGRNYKDATPTSGALYAGGAGGTLAVQVQVTRLP